MKYRLLVCLIPLLVGASVVSADTLSPWVTQSWGDWKTSELYGQAGYKPAFWNNASHDGAGCNVGYWVSGSSNCDTYFNAPPALANPNPGYLGTGSTPFGFQSTAPQVSLKVGEQVAMWGNTGVNEFGWYNQSTPGTLVPLFGGSKPPAVPGTVLTFVPSGDYGLYITSGNGQTYTSTTTDTNGQSHFAVFELDPSGHFIIGIEDNVNGGGHGTQGADFDYNDMILELDSVPVPEPASMLLLGTGLLGVAGAVRRRRLRR